MAPRFIILRVAHGLDAAGLARQIDEIDQLNSELDGITLLKGIEVDINEDGSLDLPDRVLSRLDIVIGAVHHQLKLPRQQQTARILRAMDHPFFTLLAHPTGRMLLERESLDDLRFGIGQARRSWLEKKDVLNTRSVDELKTMLSRCRRSQ